MYLLKITITHWLLPKGTAHLYHDMVLQLQCGLKQILFLSLVANFLQAEDVLLIKYWTLFRQEAQRRKKLKALLFMVNLENNC